MRIDFQRIAVAILIYSFASTSLAATIFTDNFNSGASPLWGNEQGGWSDTGGVYQSTSGSFAYSSLPANLGDFSIELDINDAWDGGIFLHSEYNGGLFNGISLITGGQGGGGRGVYWHEWTNGVHTPILNHSGTLFLPASDIHLRIDVQGDTYSAFINNILVTSLTSNLYSNGQIALINNKLRQSFDNIVVTSNITSVPEPSTIFLFIFGYPIIVMYTKVRA